MLWKIDLTGGPALVAAGRFAGERWDLAAASGSQVIIFAPGDGEYLPFARLDLGAPATALAAGGPGPAGEGADYLAASTAERVFLIGLRQGVAAILARSDPEPGSGFADLAAGDLDGDGVAEIVAAASGQGTIFVYRPLFAPGGQASLELAGIRVVPGTPRFVRVLPRPGTTPAIAVAFEQEGKSGLALYVLTERGFAEGPVLEGLPFRVTALAAGDFTTGPGSEIALGGSGGMAWLVGTGENLEVVMVTDSLGTSVSALAESQSETARLLAGTPEGNVFGFNYPVGKSPDLAFGAGEAVNSLAGVPEGRVAVGTALGGVQVWSLAAAGVEGKYIVRPGETLWMIAGKFGVTVEAILAANPNIKNRDFIIPGQIITIPAR